MTMHIQQIHESQLRTSEIDKPVPVRSRAARDCLHLLHRTITPISEPEGHRKKQLCFCHKKVHFPESVGSFASNTLRSFKVEGEPKVYVKKTRLSFRVLISHRCSHKAHEPHHLRLRRDPPCRSRHRDGHRCLHRCRGGSRRNGRH